MQPNIEVALIQIDVQQTLYKSVAGNLSIKYISINPARKLSIINFNFEITDLKIGTDHLDFGSKVANVVKSNYLVRKFSFIEEFTLNCATSPSIVY